ncbi:rhodanese-like domain-containing protein 9, chloroplastic [Tanacetum coccineum]
MAGISSCCSSALSSRSNLGTFSLRFNNTHRGGTTRISRTNVRIRAEIDFINAEEAKRLIAEEGYSVVDVRDITQYERAHIKSCKHVPLFIENKDMDPGTIVLRQMHNNFSGLFYGIPFTKPNTEFVQSVKSQFSPDSKILVVCQEGLRSAGAANKLEAAGFQNIACISSGLQSVKPGSVLIALL